MKKEELVLKWNKAVSSLRRQNKRLSELEEALEQANNRIKELEEENRWRDVNEDGNPTSDGLYNVIRKGYGLLSLNWNSHYDVWDDYENDDFECNPEEITHWKPITLPNKEEK